MGSTIDEQTKLEMTMLGNRLLKEYFEKQQAKSNEDEEIKKRRKVYVVSKYAGNVKKNVEDAKRYCKLAIRAGRIPIASHLLYPQILDDKDPEQRKLGLLFGQALLAICDEIWVCGTEYSSGMQAEIAEAKRLNKQIVYYKGKDE